MADAVIEGSRDQRTEIARGTELFLAASALQAPPSSSVQPIESNTPDYIPYSELANVSMTLGAILPITFTTWDQTKQQSMSFQMLVNPENVNWGKTNSIQMQYSRKGFITQLWGPNQEMISAVGRTAAFMVKGEGLTSFSKRRSLGFKNLLALMAAYKNNGYELLDPLKMGQSTRVINRVRSVLLSYDGNSLLGHFNNFTLDQDAEHPYSMNYNFEFVVSNSSGVYQEIRGHFLPPVDSSPTTASPLVNNQGQ